MATTKRPAKYAEGTSTPVAKTREEIERTLKKYGATGFLYGNQGDVSAVAFELKGRRYRIEVRVPEVKSFRTNYRQGESALQDLRAAEERRLWRALLMVIKAKLEAAQSGITTLEDEFLANVVLPNNETVGKWIKPQVEEVYRSGKMPPMIPGLTLDPSRMIHGPQGDIIEGEVRDGEA